MEKLAMDIQEEYAAPAIEQIISSSDIDLEVFYAGVLTAPNPG